MNSRLTSRTPHDGSALISTLLVIVVMSIIVVAFLQSMTMERQTARSYLNRYRAELAATAGADVAKALIYETTSTSKGKVNFVTWAYSPDLDTFSPFFTGVLPEAIPLNPSDSPTEGINSVADTVWLFSGPPGSKGKGSDPALVKKLVDAGDKQKFCNINFPISSSRGTTQRYWIDQSGKEYNVGWETIPSPSDPNIEIRYAFWVDDEMGRADLSMLGNKEQKVPKGDLYYPDPPNPDLFKGTGNLVLNDVDKTEAGDQPYLSNDDMEKIDEDRELVGMSPMSANQLVTPPDSGKKPSPDLPRDSLRLTSTAGTTEPLTAEEKTTPTVYDLVPYGSKAGKPKMNLNDTVNQGTEARDRVKKIHDFLATALAEEETADGGTVDETDKKKTSIYFRRKNSPPGTGWRIAASIHDYIDDEVYPTMAEQLEEHFSERVGNAYKFIKEDGGKGTPPARVYPDWEDTLLDQRWYGTKPVPFFNAFDFDGTMNSKGEPYRDYTAKYSFYLWNPSDKDFDLTDCYILIFKTSFRAAVNATRTDNGGAVEGLPYFRFDVFDLAKDTKPTAPKKITPMQQLKITLEKNYVISSSIKNANLATTSELGFILFKRGGDGKIHVLDGFASGGGVTYNRDSKSPGGQVTGSSNEWDTKDRRQSLSLHQAIWSTALTATNGNLANFQEIKRWYDRPDASDAPPATSPILHIALAPMKNLGELGNIFDPVNDLGVGVGSKYPTPGNVAPRTLPSGGTYVSRGGKTLNVGQFDEFFERLQTEAPKNPMLEDSQKWTSYEKYLRFADTVLFDMFTVRTPQESRKIRPLNVNSPRPGKLTQGTTPGDAGLDPVSTYVGSMTSALGTDALGKDPNGKALKGMTSGIQPGGKFSLAVRERLTDADWTKCRPFRNYSDLMLLGIKKANLEKTIQSSSSTSMFSAKNATAATANIPPFYLTKRGAVNVTLGTPPSPPPTAPTGLSTVQLGTNFQRQSPFARLAEQTAFRSYRYRIYAVGQVVSTKDPTHPLSTIHQTFIYDLNPKYDAATETVTFHPTLQSVVDN